MDINCEKCGTEHEIDETQLPETTAVSVQCSSCEHVFSVRRPPVDGLEILRDARPLATCPDIGTVQRWVAEGRLLRSDVLDAQGVQTRLGDMPELEFGFAAIDAAQQAADEPEQPQEPEPSPPAAAPSLAAPLFAATDPSFPMPNLTKEEPEETPSDQAVTQVMQPVAAAVDAPTMEFAARSDEPEPEQEPEPEPEPTDSDEAETLTSAPAVASETAPQAAYVAASPSPEPTSSDDDDDYEDDPEILAFKQRGQGQRRAMWVILLLLLVGAAFWFFVKPQLDGTLAADDVNADAQDTILAQAELPDTEADPADEDKADDEAEDTEAAEDEDDTESDEALEDADAEPVDEAVKEAVVTPVEKKPAPKKPAPKKKPATKTAMAKTPPVANVDALMKAGNNWMRKGDTAKAHASFDKAVSARPTHVEAVFMRGVTLYDLGKTDAAIADLKRTLELSPRFAQAMIVLAEAYKTKNDVKRARVWYENYLEAMPNGEDAHTARANLDRLR